ncbi:hypothetical protein HYV56_01370 [Candidatus Peregrinibacteria bacterium]|nr:hypothetical protein [Candidatus Peregrinibacteria bacterium]
MKFSPPRPSRNIPSYRRRRSHNIFVRFSNVIMTFVFFALFGLIGFMYLSHFNAASTKGYELNRLQSQREKLVIQNEVQNMLLSQVRALSTIKSSEKVRSMIPLLSRNITYMKTDTALAKR